MSKSRSSGPKKPGETGASGDPEALDRQRVLGSRLRSLFDDVIEEPVPDVFKNLLDKLDDDAEPS